VIRSSRTRSACCLSGLTFGVTDIPTTLRKMFIRLRLDAVPFCHREGPLEPARIASLISRLPPGEQMVFPSLTICPNLNIGDCEVKADFRTACLKLHGMDRMSKIRRSLCGSAKGGLQTYPAA